MVITDVRNNIKEYFPIVKSKKTMSNPTISSIVKLKTAGNGAPTPNINPLSFSLRVNETNTARQQLITPKMIINLEHGQKKYGVTGSKMNHKAGLPSLKYVFLASASLIADASIVLGKIRRRIRARKDSPRC